MQLVGWKNVDDATTATLAELHAAGCKSEQCVVFADANVVARVHFRAALTNEDCSCGDDRAVKYFDAKSLRV